MLKSQCIVMEEAMQNSPLLPGETKSLTLFFPNTFIIFSRAAGSVKKKHKVPNQNYFWKWFAIKLFINICKGYLKYLTLTL